MAGQKCTNHLLGARGQQDRRLRLGLSEPDRSRAEAEDGLDADLVQGLVAFPEPASDRDTGDSEATCAGGDRRRGLTGGGLGIHSSLGCQYQVGPFEQTIQTNHIEHDVSTGPEPGATKRSQPESEPTGSPGARQVEKLRRHGRKFGTTLGEIPCDHIG